MHGGESKPDDDDNDVVHNSKN